MWLKNVLGVVMVVIVYGIAYPVGDFFYRLFHKKTPEEIETERLEKEIRDAMDAALAREERSDDGLDNTL